MKTWFYILFCILPFTVVGQTYTVSGQVTIPESGEGLCEVIVTLTDAAATIQTFTTDGTGAYQFAGLVAGSYTLTAERLTGEVLNGLSTFDLVLMHKYLLGTQDIPAYKLLAADINQSGTVSVTDILLMRRLILGIDTAADIGLPVWQIFATTADWPLPGTTGSPSQTHAIIDLNSDTVLNFYAVKSADLNDSHAAPCQ